MTPEERCALAHQVYETVSHHTESFYGDDHIGGDLAYLMGVILDPTGTGFVNWKAEHSGQFPIVAILEEHFPTNHALWSFIEE